MLAGDMYLQRQGISDKNSAGIDIIPVNESLSAIIYIKPEMTLYGQSTGNRNI